MDDRLRHVIGSALKLKPSETAALTDKDTVHNVRNWDSLGHFLLVTALEKEYHISISNEDAIRLANIGAITQYLDTKGVH